MKIGFDNEKYLQMQSSHIRERINQFDNKLYLEFGGKLFDDYHASRVLPGFQPDSKLHLLKELSDTAEIVIVISAADIEANKIRGDLGITYDTDVLRLKDEFEANGLFVGSVVITQYSGQNSADLFKGRLEKLGIKVYIHYVIEGYPSNIPLIVSDEGYGRNEYIETSRPLVVITAPGPGDSAAARSRRGGATVLHPIRGSKAAAHTAGEKDGGGVCSRRRPLNGSAPTHCTSSAFCGSICSSCWCRWFEDCTMLSSTVFRWRTGFSLRSTFPTGQRVRGWILCFCWHFCRWVFCCG